MSRGACHQVWPPEFHPRTPKRRAGTDSCRLFCDFNTCAVAMRASPPCTHTQIHLQKHCIYLFGSAHATVAVREQLWRTWLPCPVALRNLTWVIWFSSKCLNPLSNSPAPMWYICWSHSVSWIPVTPTWPGNLIKMKTHGPLIWEVWLGPSLLHFHRLFIRFKCTLRFYDPLLANFSGEIHVSIVEQ